MPNAHYINIDGTQYRVAVNWNTFETFARLKGLKLTVIDKLRLDEDDNLKVMLAAAIREGERLDGKKNEIDPMSLGEVLNVRIVEQFTSIFTESMGADESCQAESEEKVSKKKK